MSNSDRNEKRRNEILQTLDAADEASADLQKEAEKIAERAQFTRDLASATRIFVAAVPNDSALITEDSDDFLRHWRDQKRVTERVLESLSLNNFTSTVSSTA